MKVVILPCILATLCLWSAHDLRAAEAEEGAFLSFAEFESPAAAGAREPALFVSEDGRVLLSWMEPIDDDRFSLRFAVRDEDGWSEPITITTDDDLFVNWADFPSLVAFPDGTLAAHWLLKDGEKTYAYDVNIGLSKDNGNTWSKPIVPHRDGTQTQHGFVSLLPFLDDKLLVIWLDGRNYSDTGSFAAVNEAHGDAMALRFTTLSKEGLLSDEEVLDPRTCTCCQTSAALTAGGAVVAYRDRSDEEIRDISILRFEEGAWSEPTTLNDDGWEISGCPVNGPAIAADGQRVAVAWFTAANGTPKVNVAFSGDGGATFGEPIRLDQGSPVGRVDVVLLPDGAALVSWLEVTIIGEEFRIRRVAPDGSRDRPIALAVTRSGRTSGFPRMVRNGDEVYFAWTQAIDTGGAPPEGRLTVRIAVAKLRR